MTSAALPPSWLKSPLDHSRIALSIAIDFVLTKSDPRATPDFGPHRVFRILSTSIVLCLLCMPQTPREGFVFCALLLLCSRSLSWRGRWVKKSGDHHGCTFAIWCSGPGSFAGLGTSHATIQKYLEDSSSTSTWFCGRGERLASPLTIPARDNLNGKIERKTARLFVMLVFCRNVYPTSDQIR